jgi:hypothetical protein
MRSLSSVRSLLLVASVLASSGAMAAPNAFLQIPGISGNSHVVGHEGFFDVQTYTLDLAPQSSKDVACLLTVTSALGRAVTAVAPGIGSPLSGDLKLELATADGTTFYRATFKGAVVSADSTSSTTPLVDKLVIRFDAVTLEVREQKADGTFTDFAVGTFTCR